MSYAKNKKSQINLRVSNTEWGYIKARSIAMGMNSSEYLRHLVMQDVLAHGHTVPWDRSAKS